MFELLKGNVDFRTLSRPERIEYRRVFDTVRETGAPHFLHGVAVEEWGGRLAVGFAFNDGAENTVTERMFVCWSDDKGRTWSRPESISPPAEYANSHSVFLPRADGLWCFGPRFLGMGERPKTKKGHLLLDFIHLETEAWKYDGETWTSMGIVGSDLWPLSAPVRMEDGCWLLSGCDHLWTAALAVSRGDDLLHWDTFKPDVDSEVFTEAAAWTQGNEVLLVMRNQSVLTDGKYHAAVALSRDSGRTFGPCELSNLPMATTKPFCGMLSDGRPFMVFNESIDGDPGLRTRLLLGVGEKGTFSLNRLWVVDEGAVSGNGRCRLSYPYAREIDGKLFIAYSYGSHGAVAYNDNDAMLAIVDVGDLK